jgi:hypothetical protein
MEHFLILSKVTEKNVHVLQRRNVLNWGFREKMLTEINEEKIVVFFHFSFCCYYLCKTFNFQKIVKNSKKLSCTQTETYRL